MDRETARTMTSVAERLLSYEAVPGKSAAGSETATFRVGEKLRRVLSLLLGGAGFRALLTRALALAKAEAPDLVAVQVAADGSLQGLGKAEPLPGGRVAKGEVVLIAQMIGLLVVFVGEALMLRLVKDAWPEAKLDDLCSGKGKSL